MNIFVAQTRPIAGDIPQNSEQHLQLVELAVSNGADLLIFPELSLTGYEPNWANQLATTLDDPRFDPFQQRSDANQLTIGVGVPLRTQAGILISLVMFQPNLPHQHYSKHYLHPDEAPFFASATTSTFATNAGISLAICYELSVPAHAERASASGATTYVASVAKSALGVTKAGKRLSEIATQYGLIVLMANSVGQSDNFVSAGQSSIWNRSGQLVGRLGSTDIGILGIDTHTQALTKQTL